MFSPKSIPDKSRNTFPTPYYSRFFIATMLTPWSCNAPRNDISLPKAKRHTLNSVQKCTKYRSLEIIIRWIIICVPFVQKEINGLITVEPVKLSPFSAISSNIRTNIRGLLRGNITRWNMLKNTCRSPSLIRRDRFVCLLDTSDAADE